MSSYFSSDIKKLNRLYQRITFSFVFLYGRYGTGKTTLLRDFCHDKRTLFYSAQETVPSQQLYSLWQETMRCLQPKTQPAVFTSWEQAFSYISDASSWHRLILVLDEIQLLAQHSSDFLDAFTAAVQRQFQAGKVFLVVTSSSPAFAQQVMLDTIKEPFDAITARAALGSIPFYSCRSDFAAYPPMDQVLLYGVTGGLPSCLNRLNTDETAYENVIRLFFRHDSPFLTAPLSDMNRELREISTYNFLLGIMASGQTRLADIAAEAGIGTNKCAKYLNTLISIGFVRKEIPAYGEPGKKVRYVFSDHMLRFWYRFVYPNLSGILFGKGREIFEQQVQPHLNEYLLPVFESVCAEYLENLASTGQTPFVYRHTGSWWTGGTKREPYFRIPLVAADSSHVVLGICHCKDEPADLSYLDRLQMQEEPFGTLTRYCLVFSSSGFTKELSDAAAQAGNVWLIEAEEMMPGDADSGIIS